MTNWKRLIGFTRWCIYWVVAIWGALTVLTLKVKILAFSSANWLHLFMFSKGMTYESRRTAGRCCGLSFCYGQGPWPPRVLLWLTFHLRRIYRSHSDSVQLPLFRSQTVCVADIYIITFWLFLPIHWLIYWCRNLALKGINAIAPYTWSHPVNVGIKKLYVIYLPKDLGCKSFHGSSKSAVPAADICNKTKSYVEWTEHFTNCLIYVLCKWGLEYLITV